MKTILLVAGDPSGDLHGSHLIRALKRQNPSLRIAAVGGPLMRECADDFLEDLSSRGVTGFWEPLTKIGFLLKLALRLKRFMAERLPVALICIDYYGFNRRILAVAKSLGIPAYYYISPQIWASRPGRIKVLKQLVRRMFVIFPFEEKLYKESELPCLFVGHPLLDLVGKPLRKEGLKAPVKIGLLPGSRASEVKRHLPIFLESFKKLCRHFPDSKAYVFAAQGLPNIAYDLSGLPNAELIRESDYKRRSTLDLTICSSGTATLENALLGIPMVVVYKLSWPTYAVARAIIRVPYISMVNILAGRSLVPELIQNQAHAANIAQAAIDLMEDPRRYASLKEELLSLRESLGRPGAAERTAEQILNEVAKGL